MADSRPSVALDAETPRATTNLQTLAEAMQRVRHRFHLDLVDWYRGATDLRGLMRLEMLFRKVNAGIGTGVLADLFGLAEIFAAALRDGRLDCDAGTRSLMGQLDRVLKPLAQPLPVWPEAEARALIDRLLDLLVGLESGDRRVLDLAAVYRSSEAIRAAQSLRRDRPAPSREDDLDRTGGRLAELVALEELLELIDRGAFVDPAALDASYAALHELVGVMDPSDACRLVPRLAAIADQMKALVSADVSEQSTLLEALAADLLALESILQAWVDDGVVAEAPSLGSGIDPAELTLAALRELDRELLGVTDLLFAAPGLEGVSIRSDVVGAMLARIAGVLRLLGLAGAADLATVCAGWVGRHDAVPDTRSVDVGRETMAEALACLRREIAARLAAGLAASAPTGCVEQALIASARAIEETSGPPMPPTPPNGASADVPSLPIARISEQERIAPALAEIFLEEIDGQIIGAATDTDLAVDGLSALVPLDGLTSWDNAPQIPIEDLLDTYEAAPEIPGESVLPDVDESPDSEAVDARSASDDVLGLSEQTLGEELDQAFSGLLDPSTEFTPDPALAPSAPRLPEVDPIPLAAPLVEQIAEIARCRAELDITHAQQVSGLAALDLGLARLRDLVDRLESDPHPGGGPIGLGVDDMGEGFGQREFCGRVGEILDDLESVRRGLIADRQASAEPRARQAKLLEAVMDALVKLNLESPD
ncbi:MULTISPECIES: hypothetical protein [unclassified Thiocapsa]|uniref:hypothetical protein n=1 Tax=unclassified Thiocapsa TaxID=2641286 RepID=UPI0035B48F9D